MPVDHEVLQVWDLHDAKIALLRVVGVQFPLEIHLWIHPAHRVLTTGRRWPEGESVSESGGKLSQSADGDRAGECLCEPESADHVVAPGCELTRAHVAVPGV